MPEVKCASPSKDKNGHNFRTPRCILYQDDEASVTLIDIPASIAAAQSSNEIQFPYLLKSCQAVQKPFAGHNEPKSEKARATLAGQMDRDLHEIHSQSIKQGLATIRNGYTGDWCLLRSTLPEDAPNLRKRKACDITSESSHHLETIVQSQDKDKQGLNVSHVLKDISGLLETLSTGRKPLPQYLVAEQQEQREGSTPSKLDTEQWSHLVDNQQPQRCTLTFNVNSGPESFHLPPKSAFYLADCSRAADFHAAVRNLAQEQEIRRHFDLIIMDPPWPNKSVKRTSASYEVASSLSELRELLDRMGVDVLLAKDGLVGVWVTNKPAVRELVLGKHGVFASWGVILEQEWIWVKTTTKGEPVTALDSLWRKPYEILLLGRKVGGEQRYGTSFDAQPVKRRVVAGVPDLHSRKPCLKTLLEPLVHFKDDYRALEIFARHLVAGWWSWGNQVLKFNHEGYWRREESCIKNMTTQDVTMPCLDGAD